MSNNANKTTVPIILGDKDTKLIIGKIIDKIDHENSQILSDSKVFNLTEKRANKPDNKYTGTHFTEQTSKYLLLQYNPSNKRLEAFPATEWYSFKKEQPKQTILSLEEIEQKMKSRNNVINSFRKKGGLEPVEDKKGRPRKVAAKANTNTNTNLPLDELPVVEEEDKKKNIDSDEFSIDDDPEWKDIPSDIEDGLFKKTQSAWDKAIVAQNGNNAKDDNSNQDLDSSDIDNGFSNEFDDADSEIDEEEVELRFKEWGEKNAKNEGADNQRFSGWGTKRARDDDSDSDSDTEKSKVHVRRLLETRWITGWMERKKMTYEEIVKDLLTTFKMQDIDMNLKYLLDKNTKMVTQGGQTFYYKK